MKIRVSVTALLFSVVLPAVFTEAHWTAAPLAESVARADGDSDKVTEVARQRFADGVKAFDSGHFEDARASFLQAYALKRNPVLLLNLGQAELKSKHPEDAGNHLQQFLREVPNASGDEKASAAKGIAEAKKKASFISVEVDANQADVSVDGAIIGKAPIADPFFVKPGKHTVLATYSGKEAVTTVDAKAGNAATATLNLGTSGAGAAAAPAAAPAPTPAAKSVMAAPAAEPAASGPATADAPPPATIEAASTADTTTSGQQESLVTWYTHKPLAWVGTGVAVAGLAVGIIFGVSAQSAANSSASNSDAIKLHAAKDPNTNNGRLHPCGSLTQSGTDILGYGAACDTVRDNISAHDTDQVVSIVGWAVMGAGVVGTAAYAILDRRAKKEPVGKAAPTWQAMPVVSSHQQGFAVTGSF